MYTFIWSIQSPQSMPVRVEVRKLTPNRRDFADQVTAQAINAAVEGVAQQVRQQVSQISCDKHPSQVSYVTIVADRHRTMRIEKRFCCEDFSGRVDISVDR